MDLGPALLERLDGDVVLSPYGLARALAAIRAGATGETREALARIDDVPEVEGILSAQAVWLGEGYTAGIIMSILGSLLLLFLYRLITGRKSAT